MSQETEQALQTTENRWQQLPAFKELKATEWVTEITKLYPDVLNPNMINEDLSSLKEISKESLRAHVLSLRSIKWVVFGAGGGMVLAFGSVASGNYPLMIPGGIVFLVGFGGGIAMGGVGSEHSSRANDLAQNFNNRGLNWLHQQRVRLFGS